MTDKQNSIDLEAFWASLSVLCPEAPNGRRAWPLGIQALEGDSVSSNLGSVTPYLGDRGQLCKLSVALYNNYDNDKVHMRSSLAQPHAPES